MKKILAFLMAVTTCFCAFTACGDNNDDDSDKSGKSTSSEKDDDKDDDDDDSDKSKDDDDDDDKSKDDDDDDDKSKDDDDDDDKSKDDDDDDDKSKDDDDEIIDIDIDEDDDDDDKNETNSGSDDVSNDVYTDVLKEFCELAINKDTEGLMNLTFPSKLIDALIEVDAYDFMVESIDGSYSSMEEVDLSMVKVSEVTDCDAETVEKLEKLYSVYSELFICMAENGISYPDMEAGNIDDEKLMLILEPAMKLSQLDDVENLDVDIIIPFEEAKFVTMSADGEDQKFVMYRVEGDDWKLDTIGLAMFGF